MFRKILPRNFAPTYFLSKQKIRTASTISIIVPIDSPFFSDFSEKKIFQKLKEARTRMDMFLKKTLEEGEGHHSRHQLSQAKKCFDRVIQSVLGENIDDLTARERKLIAQAYVGKAKILRIGSEESENIALASIEKALEIYPFSEEALFIKKSILIDRELSVEVFGNREAYQEHLQESLGVISLPDQVEANKNSTDLKLHFQKN